MLVTVYSYLILVSHIIQNDVSVPEYPMNNFTNIISGYHFVGSPSNNYLTIFFMHTIINDFV